MLEEKVHLSLRQARQKMPEGFRAMGLSPVYAFVEGEIMTAMVDALEETVELCRNLFGSSDWLALDRRPALSRGSSTFDMEAGDVEGKGWLTKFE